MSSMPMFPVFLENNWTPTPPADVFVQQHDMQTAAEQGCAASSNLSLSLSRLLDLLEDSDEDVADGITPGPTQHAFKTAFRLVERAETILGTELRASSVVDSEGGVRVTWRELDRQVKLICPATRSAPIYIYHASPSGNGLRNQNVTAKVLADRLAWMTNDESGSPEPPAG
jgi:hypothetical protein